MLFFEILNNAIIFSDDNDNFAKFHCLERWQSSGWDVGKAVYCQRVSKVESVGETDNVSDQVGNAVNRRSEGSIVDVGLT